MKKIKKALKVTGFFGKSGMKDYAWYLWNQGMNPNVRIHTSLIRKMRKMYFIK